MDISLLNQKIMVQKNSITVDEIGNHLNTWEDFYSCPCHRQRGVAKRKHRCRDGGGQHQGGLHGPLVQSSV